MAIEQKTVFRTLDAVLESAVETRRALRQTEIVTRRLRRQIEQETSVTDAMIKLGTRDVRRELSDHLVALERARREAQRAIVALAISEGASQAQVARIWGVSRQPVARIAKGRE